MHFTRSERPHLYIPIIPVATVMLYAAAVLDLVLCSSDYLVKDLDILPPIGESDHNVVVFSLDVNPSLTTDDAVHECYDWKNAEYQTIVNRMQSENWNWKCFTL